MIKILTDEPLQKHHSFAVACTAAKFIEYESVEDLERLFQEGELKDAIAIGGGSNLLFTSENVNVSLIHSCNVDTQWGETSPEGNVEVSVGAGRTLDSLVAESCKRGLWGLENLSMIPGEAGGAAVQNVGAYGVEACDIITRVEAFDVFDGSHRSFSSEELQYSYRHSMFKLPENHRRFIVTAVTFRLSASGGPRLSYDALRKEAEKLRGNATPEDIRRIVTSIRRTKLPDPAEIGSAGSFFKNPIVSRDKAVAVAAVEGLTLEETPFHTLEDGRVKLSAAWLIDRAGGKNISTAGASVWSKQPLVLVNTCGKATGSDIVALEKAITEAVRTRFSVTLQSEVIHIP